MIALGCKFALDIFTNTQQDRPPPDPVPLPLDPGLVFASDVARWPNFAMQVRSGACPRF